MAELRRVEVLRDAGDRHDRRVCYLLVRAALGAVVGVGPGDVGIGRDAAGRPRWDGPGDVSLAHTRGHVLVALGHGAVRVGVDVERVDAIDERAAADVARGFSEAERDWLAGRPHDSRVRDVLSMWVRKEAVVKADGRGLLAPLGSLSVRAGLSLDALGHVGTWRVDDLDTVLPGDAVGAVATVSLGEQPRVTQERDDRSG